MSNPSPDTPASLGPPPRKVRYSGPPSLTQWFLMLLFLLFSALAILLTSHIILSLLTPVLGTPIPGQTVSIETDTDNNGDDIYKLHYTYQLSGQTIQTWDNIQESEYRKYAAKPHPQPITVSCLRLGPFSRSNPNSFSSQVHWLYGNILFTLLQDAILLGIALYFWRKHLQAKRILQVGTAISGTITSRRKDEGAEDASYHITYTYTHPFTREPIAIECSIHSTTWDAAYLNRPITVLYDPDNPHKSLIYEFSDFKIIP